MHLTLKPLHFIRMIEPNISLPSIYILPLIIRIKHVNNILTKIQLHFIEEKQWPIKEKPD